MAWVERGVFFAVRQHEADVTERETSALQCRLMAS